MKKSIRLMIAVLLLTVSSGGCFIFFDKGGHRGGGEHDRGGHRDGGGGGHGGRH